MMNLSTLSLRMSLAGMLVMAVAASCVRAPGDDARVSDTCPTLYPDIAGVTLPRNIAAPTFMIDTVASHYHTAIGVAGDEPAIICSSSSAAVRPPLDKWHELLGEAAGGEITITVSIETDGVWTRLQPVTCRVSTETVDSFLVYRLLYPGYELWNELGIYQRDLTSYEQTAVIENRDIDRQCVNCHTFRGTDPSEMMLHVRGPHGGTLIVRDGKVTKVNPKSSGTPHGATYPAWHPSGRFIAFSANEIRQFFHTSGTKTIEVSDLGADMTLYDVERDEANVIPMLSGEEWMETFPTWSPDGKELYFCRAAGYREGTPLDSIRYNLCRISFDPDSVRFGEPEVVWDAAAEGHSVSFPRVSPDGRWLLMTVSDYGNFSIWHPESDLWLMDLNDLSVRVATELNSDNVDSFHSWSGNGRWVVFSSKRLDTLWSRPYIASFDPATGRFGLPFILPQKDPLFYDSFTRTFNLPAFSSSPLPPSSDLIEAVYR